MTPVTVNMKQPYSVTIAEGENEEAAFNDLLVWTKAMPGSSHALKHLQPCLPRKPLYWLFRRSIFYTRFSFSYLFQELRTLIKLVSVCVTSWNLQAVVGEVKFAIEKMHVPPEEIQGMM